MRSKRGKKFQQTPFNLFGLPVELQIIIFKFTLQDPTLWDRHHRDGCNLRPTEEGVIEHPPWIWHRPIIGAVRSEHTKKTGTALCSYPVSYTLVNTWKFCNCAKRSGISLLRTNCYAFSVAAPLFWSKARFCFFDAAEFAACVAATSSRTRALIRDVSIVSSESWRMRDMRVCIQNMGASMDGRADKSFYLYSKLVFRNALKHLPGLEHLAVPSDFVYFFTRTNQLGEYEITDTLMDLLQLRFLELTQMRLFGGSSNLRQYMLDDRVDFWAALYRNRGWASFVAYSRRFDVRGSVAAMHMMLRPLYSDYGIVDMIYLDLLTVGLRCWETTASGSHRMPTSSAAAKLWPSSSRIT
ncbi:hypothetical protein LMH87_010424 [Akanthomyces muscarius]|uniref:Uncharacterized protein n=1 Tax=Akanthomyces muscarius TaxID=2231603 RepID=A0A9W8QG14_AKAMU|nr:hypothetical protein LMH87_010424 [Akanthomyces muscarius]KAJ4153959.1 hypothetical protein LMH87_010424 [Akanthomyces muscarius]